MRENRDKAFTLIELLVVIAIISLLVSILLPSLDRARRHARTVVCAGNVRQVGVAMQLYLADNHQHYPQDVNTPGWSERHPRWWPMMGKYTGDNWGQWTGSEWPDKSPASTAGEGTIGRCPNHTEHPGSYSIRANSLLIAVPGTTVSGDSVEDASGRLLVFECHTVCYIPKAGHAWYAGWLKPPFGAGGIYVNTHDKVSNFLMADSHVESFDFSRMMTYYIWYWPAYR